jgi:predicted RNase H-like HicB family nuclease
VLLTPDLEEGGYTVTVPALPGCVSEGDTVAEALANIQDAMRLYIETLQAHGQPVPDEARRPEVHVVEV